MDWSCRENGWNIRIPKQALHWEVAGFRPRMNWRDVVKKDLQRMGLTWKEVEASAQDRHSWHQRVALCIGDAEWIKVKNYLASHHACCFYKTKTIYTKRRPRLFHNALVSLLIHSVVWGQFSGSNLRVSQRVMSVRLSIRLAYSCIFRPSCLLPRFPLPHFQSLRWINYYQFICFEKLKRSRQYYSNRTVNGADKQNRTE